MKERINVEKIEQTVDFEKVSKKLMVLAEGRKSGRKTVADLLNKVKPALLKAREHKVPFSALAEALKDCGIPISEPSLRQYLNGLSSRKKDSTAEPKSPKTSPVQISDTHHQILEELRKLSVTIHWLELKHAQTKKPYFGVMFTAEQDMWVGRIGSDRKIFIGLREKENPLQSDAPLSSAGEGVPPVK